MSSRISLRLDSYQVSGDIVLVPNGICYTKRVSAHSWVSAHIYMPTFTASISEPLLNMRTASYMSAITKRGLTTMGGQIPIEIHYRPFISLLEL